jgi:hypothetical protein
VAASRGARRSPFRAGCAIKPDDVAATFYATLGIDHRHEYHASSGRPVQIVRDGVALDELM